MSHKKARNIDGSPMKAFVCTECKNDNCIRCIDVARVVFKMEEICKCRRQNHRGEPRDRQIKDPFTGAVHAPGLRVTKDGEVILNDETL